MSRHSRERAQRLTEFRERLAEFRETRGAGDSGARMQEALRRETTAEDFKQGLDELTRPAQDEARARRERFKALGATWQKEE